MFTGGMPIKNIKPTITMCCDEKYLGTYIPAPGPGIRSLPGTGKTGGKETLQTGEN